MKLSKLLSVLVFFGIFVKSEIMGPMPSGISGDVVYVNSDDIIWAGQSLDKNSSIIFVRGDDSPIQVKGDLKTTLEKLMYVGVVK